MTKGVHRVPAGTKTARRIMSNSKYGAPIESADPEIRAHNAEIEAKRKAKEHRKLNGKS